MIRQTGFFDPQNRFENPLFCTAIRNFSDKKNPGHRGNGLGFCRFQALGLPPQPHAGLGNQVL